MPDSVYKVIELIGTSTESWEKAAAAAVSRAGESLRDLRVAEVVKLDLQLDAKRQGRSLPRQAERLVQVRGVVSEACVGWAKRSACPPFHQRMATRMRFAHPTNLRLRYSAGSALT